MMGGAGQNRDSPLVERERQPRHDLCHNGLMPSLATAELVIQVSDFGLNLILTAAKQVAAFYYPSTSV